MKERGLNQGLADLLIDSERVQSNIRTLYEYRTVLDGRSTGWEREGGIALSSRKMSRYQRSARGGAQSAVPR